MPYLTVDEGPDYGLSGVTVQQIAQAGTIIDAHLGRPEGLIWSPDALGLPAYMAALTPSLSLTLPSAITRGSNVVVPFPAASSGMIDVGEVFVADRANVERCEALAVAGVDLAAGTITIDRVAFAHDAGAMMETGLQIVEERALAAKRSQTRVTKTPVTRLLSGCGRYGYGRRSNQVAGDYNDINLLATAQVFGGPPAWVPFDIRQASVSPTTGEIWVPAGMLLASYSDVRLRYVAGFPQSAVPIAVKRAAANIIGKFQSFDDADPSFKIFQAGGTKLERWTDSALDTDTKALLAPYSLTLVY